MADKRDPYDGDYIGNIFGWKLSAYGAIFILVLLAIAAYRHYTLDVPVGFDGPTEEEKARYAPAGRADRAKDSLRVE